MTVNIDDSTFWSQGRNMRSLWRAQEEEQISESLEYSKRQLTLLDYLASVSHAGNEISVRTLNYVSRGALVHIGKDFFSIVSPQLPRLIHSFFFNEESTSTNSKNIEIDVLDKTSKAQNVRLLRHDKSFKSLLDDIAIQPEGTEVETEQGHLYVGSFSLFSDCIAISKKGAESQEQSLVLPGTTIIPIGGIVSILYSV